MQQTVKNCSSVGKKLLVFSCMIALFLEERRRAASLAWKINTIPRKKRGGLEKTTRRECHFSYIWRVVIKTRHIAKTQVFENRSQKKRGNGNSMNFSSCVLWRDGGSHGDTLMRWVSDTCSVNPLGILRRLVGELKNYFAHCLCPIHNAREY